MRAGTIVKLAGLLTAAMVLVAALLVFRVVNGPLSIRFLNPLIEDALSASDQSFRIRIADTVLSLAEDKKSLVVVTHRVRLENRGGATLATIPELTLGFSLEAMLRGIIALTRIVVAEPELRLERAPDGAFQLGIGGEGGTSAELTQQLLREFLEAPNPDSRAGYLKEISVRGASLTVEDHMLRASWQARRAAATVFRGEQGMFGDLALAVDLGDSTAELHGEFHYSGPDHRLAVGFTIADWELAKLQRIAPVLAPLAGLATPISGSVELSLDTTTTRVEGARIDLTAGPGAIAHPALVGGSLPIAGGQLKASYDTASARLTLHELTLDLGGPVATIKATVDGFDIHQLLVGEATSDLAVAAEVVARRMPANDLGRFWPPSLAVNARSWVTANIRDGTVDEASLSTRFHIKPDGSAPAGFDAFGGSMKMRGLTVDYHQPLPPVRNVDGTATFDQRRMTLLPTSGTLKGQRITGGTIVITDLDVVDQWINIAVDVNGPVRDALEVIDAKPLEYARQVGIDPARVEGSFDGHLSFYFMLDHRTTFAQVELGVAAQLNGVALRKIAFGQDLTEGNLKLRLDRASLQLDGTGRLAGAPATIGWLQYFKPRDGLRSRYTVQAPLDEAARRTLGLDPPAGLVLAGPVDVNATLKSFADKHGEASMAVDLKGAALAAADLNWSKPAGTPANATLELDLADDRLAAIRAATIKGPGIDVTLAATFDKGDLGLQRLDIGRLVLGDTDLRGSVARRSAGGWRAELQGAALDATGFAGNLNKPGATKPDEPPLVVDAKFDRVVLGRKREARNVVLQLRSDGKHWQSVRLDAAPFGQGTLKLIFGEAGGEKPFTVTTSDLGATLRLLDVSDHVAGGQVTVTGRAEDAGAVRSFVGHIDGGDYRIIGAPVMAKLLSLASFTSIGSLLAGEGIPFSRLTGDFRATGGTVTLRQFRAYGGAIGVNASGTLDLDASTLDLDGTLVPAYTLNSILGNIPVIGDLLLGGPGQGIFAAGFHAEGPLDDPKISVNPLSALAPGVLRNLFLFDSGNGQSPASKAPGDSK